MHRPQGKQLLSVVTILLHRANNYLPNEIVWQLSKLLDPSALRLKKVISQKGADF